MIPLGKYIYFFSSNLEKCISLKSPPNYLQSLWREVINEFRSITKAGSPSNGRFSNFINLIVLIKEEK